MTFGPRNIVGVVQARQIHGLVFDKTHWPWIAQKMFDYTLGCHMGHALELLVALVFYTFVWPLTFPLASALTWDWISRVVAFNLACELVFFGGWHCFTYMSPFVSGIRPFKYNTTDPYASDASSGNLRREILLTTLGWLQSSAYCVLMMHAWASGRLAFISDFFAPDVPGGSMLWSAHTAFNVASVLFVTYWREFHFYWCHRAMHPWWDRKNGLAQGDVGAFLYRHVHSWHHKSYNPGPWAGLSMHPVEHFMYYTCTLLPLLVRVHPLVFLYAKFHADIAPIGGHDGYNLPGGGGDFHWLHHDKYECNYGVPLIPFDKLFGTWVDYADVKRVGYSAAKARAKGLPATDDGDDRAADSGLTPASRSSRRSNGSKKSE